MSSEDDGVGGGDGLEFDQSLSLRADTAFDRAVIYLATALFALTIVLASIQVLLRQLGLDPYGLAYWTEPAARYVLIVATYFGAAVASRNNEHIKLEFLLDKLEERYPNVRLAFDLAVAVLVVTFVVVALGGTGGNAIGSWETQIGGIGVVSSGMLYLGIAAGLAAMLLYETINLGERVRTARDRWGGR